MEKMGTEVMDQHKRSRTFDWSSIGMLREDTSWGKTLSIAILISLCALDTGEFRPNMKVDSNGTFNTMSLRRKNLTLTMMMVPNNA